MVLVHDSEARRAAEEGTILKRHRASSTMQHGPLCILLGAGSVSPRPVKGVALPIQGHLLREALAGDLGV